MKSLVFLSLILIASLGTAQQHHTFTRIPFTDDISFIRFDTAQAAQSTVIEYPTFLVVIELPLIEAGGGRSTDLAEDIPRAEKFLNYLENEYQKQVGYVLSSHWHLHSLSGITPFFKKGAKLVVAKSNWKYSLDHGLMKKNEADAFDQQIIPITRDTALFRHTQNPIDVLFLDETYTFKPTKDYLFFYLPARKTLHASCMCALADIDFQRQLKFVYNDRVSDLGKAISSRQLEVSHLIKLSAEYDRTAKAFKSVVFSQAYYAAFRKHGTPMHQVVKVYSACPQEKLANRQDSILHYLVENRVSPGIINSTVYACLRERQWEKAIGWAKLLNLYRAGDANYIDTLGEACYRAGDSRLANYYSELLSSLDARNFPDALRVWQQNQANEGR